jgi:hypothetical protein
MLTETIAEYVDDTDFVHSVQKQLQLFRLHAYCRKEG